LTAGSTKSKPWLKDFSSEVLHPLFRINYERRCLDRLFASSSHRIGFLYQWFGSRSDRRLYAGLGRLVSIGHRNKLYLLEKGQVVRRCCLKAGIAATNLNWFHIQETVSHFTGNSILRPWWPWLEQPLPHRAHAWQHRS